VKSVSVVLRLSGDKKRHVGGTGWDRWDVWWAQLGRIVGPVGTNGTRWDVRCDQMGCVPL
jgi:hypothetical protein